MWRGRGRVEEQGVCGEEGEHGEGLDYERWELSSVVRLETVCVCFEIETKAGECCGVWS